MHRKLYWMILLLVLGSCVLYYSAGTLYKIYHYTRLSSTTVPSEAQPEVEVLNEDEDAVVILYRFNVDSMPYYGKWRAKVIPNTPMAEEDLEKFRSKEWTVWYDPAAPSYSALDKHFPWKETVSMIILWALFSYFIALSQYVNLKNPQR